MRRKIVILLVGLSILALIFQVVLYLKPSLFPASSRAGLRVLSAPEGAQVYLDGEAVGKTPYNNEGLTEKEYSVKLEATEGVWEGKVKLNGSTLTVINRELSSIPQGAAGEVLTLEKGQGVVVLSYPDQAQIEVDGKIYEKTPVSVDIPAGEHSFTVSKGNYLKRSIKASIPQGYALTLSVDLALSEPDLTQVTASVITTTPKVIVKNTPTGFLRVREQATTSSKEVARVAPGDELILIEEMGNWSKVRLEDGKEGFVSNTYVDKMKD